MSSRRVRDVRFLRADRPFFCVCVARGSSASKLVDLAVEAMKGDGAEQVSCLRSLSSERRRAQG